MPRLEQRRPINSPYAEVAGKYLKQNIPVVPCRPGSKVPGIYNGKSWSHMPKWQQYADHIPPSFMARNWYTWPDAGVSLILGGLKRLVAIDLDSDDPRILQAVEPLFPPSPARKTGRVGYTGLYIDPDHSFPQTIRIAIYTGDLRNDGRPKAKRVFEILSDGAQTVIPPSIHPDTNRPYFWQDKSLADIGTDNLPVIPSELEALVIKALLNAGFQVVGHTPELDGMGVRKAQRQIPVWGELTQSSDVSTPHRELNDKALQDLDTWVPALPWSRPPARTPGGYRAIADWRSSGSAKPDEKRGFNVGIHPTGIVDFGDPTGGGPNGQSYTPLDLVMAAFRRDLDWAYSWLTGQVSNKSDWVSPALTVTRGVDHKSGDNQAVKEKISPEILSQNTGQEPNKSDESINGYSSDTGVNTSEVIKPELHLIVNEEAITKASIEEDIKDLPDHLCSLPGVGQAYIDWVLEKSASPIKTFGLMSALGFFAALMGRRYLGPTGLSPSLYLLGIAPSGFGKDDPQTLLKVLDRAAKTKCCGMEGFTSGTALEQALVEMPSQVVIVDELADFLQSITGGQSGRRMTPPHIAEIEKLLKTLFGRSKNGATHYTKRSASSRGHDGAPKQIITPALSIMGMTTPKVVGSLPAHTIGDGFLNRWLAFQVIERPPVDEVDFGADMTPPQRLLDLVDRVANQGREGNLAQWSALSFDQDPDWVKVDWEDSSVKDAWFSLRKSYALFEDSCPERSEDEAQMGSDVRKRGAENVIRLATLRAVLEQPSAPMVTHDDLDWGYAIIEHSIGIMERLAVGILGAGDSEFGKAKKEVLRAIEKSTRDGIEKGAKNMGATKTQIFRMGAMSDMKDRDKWDVIKALEGEGRVQMIRRGRGHRFIAKRFIVINGGDPDGHD